MWAWAIKYAVITYGVPFVLKIVADNVKPKTSKEKDELDAAMKQFNETIKRKQSGR
jgi:hypothetical protein